MRTAVVTGAGGGLGGALCAALAADGYEVIGVDVRGAERVLDVTDAQACRQLAVEVEPVLWVNNAGVGSSGFVLDQDDDAIERLVAVNLLGVVNGSRAAAEVMLERHGGRILNVGSLAAWFAAPGQAVYAATKHAVRAFSVAFASELRGTGVRVQVLCPDGIDTPLLADAYDDPSRAFSFTGSRLLSAEEVASSALRLLRSRRAVASVPHRRGVVPRVLGVVPSLSSALVPGIQRKGLRRQARLRVVRGDSGESQEAK